MTRRVLVVYPYLSHYRFGVFNALESSEDLHVEFAAGSRGEDGIEAMPRDAVETFHELQNVRALGLRWQRGLLRLLVTRRFDDYVFLGDAKILSTWVALLALRVTRRRTYLWTIGWHRPERGLKKRARLMFYGLADALLLYGNVGKSIGVSLGFSPERMHVIYNSAESRVHEHISDVSIRNSVSDLRRGSTYTLGAVIRLTPQKRLDQLISAAALLGQWGFKVRVVLVGEGPCRDTLASQAAALGVELHLGGATYDRQALQDVYHLLDLTVVPCTVGLTGIQSLAHGTPVLSNDDAYSQAPEWEAIVPSRTGAHFRAGDVSALAEAIERWATTMQDAETVAEECRTEVRERWSPHPQAGRIIEVLTGPTSGERQ